MGTPPPPPSDDEDKRSRSRSARSGASKGGDDAVQARPSGRAKTAEGARDSTRKRSASRTKVAENRPTGEWIAENRPTGDGWVTVSRKIRRSRSRSPEVKKARRASVSKRKHSESSDVGSNGDTGSDE